MFHFQMYDSEMHDSVHLIWDAFGVFVFIPGIRELGVLILQQLRISVKLQNILSCRRSRSPITAKDPGLQKLKKIQASKISKTTIL